MFVERQQQVGEVTSQERRGESQPDARVLGRVVQCDGSRATLAAFAMDVAGEPQGLWSVGRMISINLGDIRTVGLVYRIEAAQQGWSEDGQNPITVQVELVGEVRDVDGKPVFDRGITVYPHIGAIAHRIRQLDLAAIYDLGGRKAVDIGALSQDSAIAARIAIDDTLSRHFAVVGTTGVGKSTAVSLLIRKAVQARPDLRVLILDPHNEFSNAFPDQSIRIDTSTLDLPFWLFRLEELTEVLYRGREPVAEEIDLLRELVPLAKQMYRLPQQTVLQRRATDPMGLTADTPVPYRMADVLRTIDERIGQLDAKADRPIYRSLRSRIEAAVNDPLYRFMFATRMVDDNIHDTVGRIFRIPHQGRPITCLELAGLPSEIVNSVCSVLARLAFDVAMNSHGKLKLLVLCEEAHRYMPTDPRLGFAPTRHALSRIAKEGRKYGCYLGVVTQRPGELDPTVLSQCSTVFAMRLANEIDQDIVRSAIADSSASTLSFLSSMGQREAIAFGEGVATTMRMRFEQLPAQELPGTTQSHNTSSGDPHAEPDLNLLVNNLRSMLRATPSQSIGHVGVPTSSNAQPGDEAFGSYRSTAPALQPRLTSEREAPRRVFDQDALRRLYE